MLKDKANGVPSQASERMVVQLSCIFAIDGQLARGGPVQQTNDVEQGAFARPRGPHHCTKITTGQLQIDVVKNFNVVGLAHIERFAYFSEFDHPVCVCQFIHEWPPQDLNEQLAERAQRKQ